MTFDQYIFKKINSYKYKNQKYQEFFAPEIKQLKNKNEEISEDFDKKRKQGENDDVLCQIIRNDSVGEFVSYAKKKKLTANSCIESSIFETNPFLLKKEKVSIVEYAAFFGSIQIIKNLNMERSDFTPSLWFCAIHSQNIELIHLLEENIDVKQNLSYEDCFYESIKSQQIDMTNYFLYNFVKYEEENSQNTFVRCIKNYNYAFVQSNLVNDSMFHDLCKFDYYQLVSILLQKRSIDINQKKKKTYIQIV